MKFILKFLKRIFEAKNSLKEFKPRRSELKDVKPGEYIFIEWYRIKGGIGELKCINNEPETKKILLEVTWSNYKEENIPKKERIILNYNSTELSSFSLLNPIKEEFVSVIKEEELDISTLQKKINLAIEKEDYMEANNLQKQIDEILKKKK